MMNWKRGSGKNTVAAFSSWAGNRNNAVIPLEIFPEKTG